jgi:DNA-directed RNA polymerase subunit beta
MNSLPENTHRERKDFSRIKTKIPIPNLIEIQRKSYERFLQMNYLPSEREDHGLQSVFKSVFPLETGSVSAESFQGYSNFGRLVQSVELQSLLTLMVARTCCVLNAVSRTMHALKFVISAPQQLV